MFLVHKHVYDRARLLIVIQLRPCLHDNNGSDYSEIGRGIDKNVGKIRSIKISFVQLDVFQSVKLPQITFRARLYVYEINRCVSTRRGRRNGVTQKFGLPAKIKNGLLKYSLDKS